MLNESTLGLNTSAVKLRKYLECGSWCAETMQGGFTGLKMQGWMHKETDYQMFNPINFLRATEYIKIHETAVPRGPETIRTVNCSDWVKLRYNIIIMKWLKRQGRAHLSWCGSMEKLFVCINHSQLGVWNDGIFTALRQQSNNTDSARDSLIKALSSARKCPPNG